MRVGSYLLIVNREQFTLQIWRRGSIPPRAYRLVDTVPVSIGMVGFRTPAGVYFILARAKNPDWLVPDEDWAGDLRGQLIKAGDPRNPIQGAFLKLTEGKEGGVGIHGTADLDSLGTKASHGCIRVRPAVALDLYRRVRKGTPVVVL